MNPGEARRSVRIGRARGHYGVTVIQGTAEAAPRLGQSLRSRHVTMITIGGIIGAGLFVGSSASIATTGPAIILSYALAGAVMIIVMRMLSEMAVAFPEIGAFTEFSREGLGNWAGFTSGWLYWLNWAIIAAIEAIAGARIIHDWLPAFPIWVIGWTLLAAMTAVNLLSTRSYGEFEFWFASLKVAAIIVFIVLGLAFVLGHSPLAQVANLYSHRGFSPFGPAAVFSGVVSVIFALCGAEIATIAAAESPDPARTVARMTGSVSLRILLFYVISITLIVMIVPWTQIHPGDSPFATALTAMRIPAAAFGMKLIVLTAVLSCLNSSIYVTSRVLFTLSAHGDAPGALVKLNKRQVPARAILFSSLTGYAAVFASVVSPELVFAFLINAAGSIIMVVYIITALAQIRLRHRLDRTAPERLKVKVWLFPALSYFAVAAMVGVLGAMFLIAEHRAEIISGLVCLAGALALYAIFRLGRDGKAAAVSAGR
jgi:L-asparagine transporter-like permease